MPKRVKLPDGSTGVFPDAMSDSDIEGVLQKQFPFPPAPTSAGDGKPWYALDKTVQLPSWMHLPASVDTAIGEFARPRTAAEIAAEKGNEKANPWALQADQSVENVTRRALGGVASMAVHPLDTLEGTYQVGKELVTTPFTPASDKPQGPIEERIKQFQDEYKKSKRTAIENLSGDLLGMYLSGKLLDAGGKVIKPVLGPLGEKAANVLRPKKVVGELVDSTRAENEASATKAREANQTATEKTLQERGKVDEANAAQAAKEKAERIATEKSNRDAAQAHATKKSDIEAQNREALRQQEKIAPTKEKLQSASSEFRARVETARENALKVGNEKYNGVNEALNELPADSESIIGAYSEALNSIGEAQGTPAILKRMEKSVHEPLTYKDEQALYSELGKELSKGNLLGTTYQAYDILHEAVGNDMQRIADSQGMGQQLLDARNYWRRMKQTFGKSLTMGDNATAALKSADPGFVSGDVEANRLRLLGSFDPEIPKVATHVENLRTGLKALGEAKPTREVVKVPPPKPEPTPAPKPTTPKEYSEPHGSTPRVEKKIGSADVQTAKENVMHERSDWLRRRGKWAAAWPAFSLLRDGLRGNGLAFGEAGAEVAGTLAATHAIARLLESRPVLDFLTKATPADMEQIPPDIRGDFPNIVKAAKAKGVPLSPAIAKAFGVAGVLNHPTFSQQSPVRP